MRFAIALAAALALAAPTAPAASETAQPSATDWVQRVERTREGGHRMGSPNAPLKLVEYGSISCSHCADFEATAGDEILDHVRSGRLSFEYRPHPIFPADPGIFLLLQCQAPEKFFTTVHTLYQTQGQWSAQMNAKGAELGAEIERTSFVAAFPSIVRASGTDALFRANGLTDAQIAACLTDGAAINRLGLAKEQAEARGVNSTPTFFLNGERVDVVNSWAELLVRLRQP